MTALYIWLGVLILSVIGIFAFSWVSDRVGAGTGAELACIGLWLASIICGGIALFAIFIVLMFISIASAL